MCQKQFNLFMGLCAQIKLGTIQVENRFPAKKKKKKKLYTAKA